MAYGNWGAFVHRNGERVNDNEDASPFPKREGEMFAQTFHAVLGQGRVLLTGYKHWPAVYVDGSEHPIAPYKLTREDEGDDGAWAGTVEGHEFKATQRNGNMIDLWLKEPDGTQWQSTCGYGYGAGHMD